MTLGRSVKLTVGLISLLLMGSPALGQSLYWTDTIYPVPRAGHASTTGTGVQIFGLSSTKLPEGIDVDALNGHMYWVESAFTGGRIMRSDLDLTSAAPVVSGGSCMRGLAVDPAGGKIYWSTSNLITGATISRANLDGSSPSVLIALGAGANPRGVALDTQSGRIYWADYDLGMIRRANLDGTAMTTVLPLSPANAGAWGIAIDRTAGKVYWTEYAAGNIRRANFNGSGIELLCSGLGNPTYLTLDAPSDFMYWIEATAGAQRMRRAHRDGSSIQTIPIVISSYGGIVIAPTVPVGIHDDPVSALSFGPVLPNPSSGQIGVDFALPRASNVRLSVIDVQGREVDRVLEHRFEPGRYHASWSGESRRGEPAAPGVYFLRFTTAEGDRVRSFVLAR